MRILIPSHASLLKVPYCTSIAPETASPDMKSQGARRTLLSILTDSRVAEESVHAQALGAPNFGGVEVPKSHPQKARSA